VINSRCYLNSIDFFVAKESCMNLKISGCPRVAKKLHNLFVIKDINFYFSLDDSYASTAHLENIAVYIHCVSIL
jgi:hypothetical protein